MNAARKPFHPSVALHTETSQLILTANQLTGFYMAGILVENDIKRISYRHKSTDFDRKSID